MAVFQGLKKLKNVTFEVDSMHSSLRQVLLFLKVIVLSNIPKAENELQIVNGFIYVY